jgi:hypothetical protein
MTSRRAFMSLLAGSASLWPLAVRAQQPDQLRRIGVLMGYAESDRDARACYAAFQEALQKLGWTEGRNIQIDGRNLRIEACNESKLTPAIPSRASCSIRCRSRSTNPSS